MRGLAALALLAGGVLAIWPIPAQYSSGEHILWLDRSNLNIKFNDISYGINRHGVKRAVSNNTVASRMVTNAVERAYDTLFNKNFVPWMFHPRMSDFEPACGSSATFVHTIRLQQTSILRRSSSLNQTNSTDSYHDSVDESYSLELSTDGEVFIAANSSNGIVHAMTTLTQLFYQHSDGSVYTPLAPVSIINDKPKFEHRGLNIDTSRTFKPMSTMYAMVDAMSYNKMNRLHWHVTDGQAWPLEILCMPELAKKGAYAPFQIYSAQDVKALQEYAALLGIEVVMEIDMPGHTSSIALSHPELIAAFNWQPVWGDVANEPPSGTLMLNSTAVYDFLENMFDDLWPRLKPLSRYFHLGGDEVNVNAYNYDPTVGTDDEAVLQPLMQKFMDRNIKQLKSYGLTAVVWEEMVTYWNLSLPMDTIVQSWLDSDSVTAITALGYRTLVGNYQYWYLDCGRGAWTDFYQNEAAYYWPFEDWCGPFHNWRMMYAYDPLDGVPAEQAHLVIGGEAHIWSELTDSVNLDSMVWPRTCAVAEVLWSGAKDEHGRNRSQVTASPRLAEMRERLVAQGIRAEVVQMPYCTMNGSQCVQPLRPGEFDPERV